MKQKNLFIAFEGIDGSGKSTQVKLLAQKLHEAGHKVYVTAEPTNSPIGSLIRKSFRGDLDFDDRVIAALFVADRLDHILHAANGILAKMQNGYTVITDRYYLSSYAYQADYLPLDWLIAANKPCAELLRPAINIVLDIDIECSMSRIASRNEGQERYETMSKQINVKNNLDIAIKRLGHEENIKIVDGTSTPDIIAEKVWTLVKELC